jgi:signal transduction histidine kinase
MTLQGHAEQLEAAGTGVMTGIAEAARNVFGIADYMDEWVQHAQPTHVLHEEVLDLGAVLDEAITEVRLAMEPGRRAWLVEPEVLPIRLRADRRAVRHVLARALSLSALSSNPDAGVQIKLERGDSTLALMVTSQPRPETRGQARAASAEPDPRLALARTLMEAHGGALEVEDSDSAGRPSSISASATANNVSANTGSFLANTSR